MDRLTDYDAHGSQYVLILFQWLRADTGDLQGGNPKRDGRLAMLMCVAVNIAASRGELPDPGHDYLEAVEGKEAGSGSGQRQPSMVLSVLVVGIVVGLIGLA